MNEELLPCPFCGSEAELIQEPLFGSDSVTGYIRVQCKNPDCEMGNPDCLYDVSELNKSAIIKTWNTRTTPDRWISVEEKPIPVNQSIVAGLYVENKSLDRTYWEEHLICVTDEMEIIESEEYFTAWELEDFTHWRPIPKPPEAK